MLHRRIEIEEKDFRKKYCINDRLKVHTLGSIIDYRVIGTYPNGLEFLLIIYYVVPPLSDF
jgi:hypothetical protein